MSDALNEGTADGNHDGIITALELATKIQYDVPFYADVHGGKQTPQYTKLTPDAGDFMFILDPSALENMNDVEANLISSDQDEIARSFQKKLVIRANVDNARIYVNDTERGYLTNNELTLPMSAGIYNVSIKKDRYEDGARDIVITPRDSTAVVEFDLESTHSSVYFDIEPNDAIVYVDADYTGARTFTEAIPKGRKRIEVSKEGYVTDIRTANITQDSLHYTVDQQDRGADGDGGGGRSAHCQKAAGRDSEEAPDSRHFWCRRVHGAQLPRIPAPRHG